MEQVMETTTTEQQEVAAANVDCEKVIGILGMIIDDEARDEEKNYFFQHIEQCATCFEEHKHQKMLKDFLKRNVTRKDVPANLVSVIQNLVKETI